MLPEQLVGLQRLSSLAVPFNRFITLPLVAAHMTHIQVSDVEVVSLAGNNIERLASEELNELKYAKRLDLRLNELTLPTTDTLKFAVLDRLTHLDVRDNHISELDLRVLRSLEYLNCERNSMVSLHLNGTSLRSLAAAKNRESRMHFSPLCVILLLLLFLFEQCGQGVKNAYLSCLKYDVKLCLL